MIQSNSDIDRQATTWYLELCVHQRLERWDEFDSWLHADPRHLEAYKSLEKGLPKLLLNFVYGSK